MPRRSPKSKDADPAGPARKKQESILGLLKKSLKNNTSRPNSPPDEREKARTSEVEHLVSTLERVREAFEQSDPYSVSALPIWLKYESWQPHEALLLLSDLEPHTALVEWPDGGGQNKTGSENPRVKEATLLSEFDCDDKSVVDPEVDHGDDGLRYYRFKCRQALIPKVADASVRLSNIYQMWSRSRAPCSEAGESPTFYIEWALEKGLDIPWFAWAQDNGFLTLDSLEGDKDDTPPTSPLPPQLSSREKNTLLVIIAALANALEIDLNRPYEAGTRIEELTELIGARVSQDTIVNKLRDIADALESRSR